MAIRLVRESSETPNVTNKDDSKMIRYAYGGYDGIIKNYGTEVSASYSSGLLHLGSGRIVLQGWEVDLDELGGDVTLDIIEGEYQSVYLELNLAAETAQIKTMSGISEYPEVDYGDDLTQSPSGTARLLLYQVRLENALTAVIERKCVIIDYAKKIFEDLDNRLKNQGFSQASVQNGEIVLSDDWTDAYTTPDSLLEPENINSNPSGTLVKSGIISWMKSLECYTSNSSKIEEKGTSTVNILPDIAAKIPIRFVPNYSIEIEGEITFWVKLFDAGLSLTYASKHSKKVLFTLSSDGSISIPKTNIPYYPPSVGTNGSMLYDSSHPIGISIKSESWFIQDPLEE